MKDLKIARVCLRRRGGEHEGIEFCFDLANGDKIVLPLTMNEFHDVWDVFAKDPLSEPPQTLDEACESRIIKKIKSFVSVVVPGETFHKRTIGFIVRKRNADRIVQPDDPLREYKRRYILQFIQPWKPIYNKKDFLAYRQMRKLERDHKQKIDFLNAIWK